ncbi:MAG: hypothetical protein IPK16_21670 [Anaerolineales bacterium]|nr:hypothetical protein [Anaerolineales bacterium]
MQTNPDLPAQTWIDRYVHQALRYQPTSEHKAAEAYVRAQIDTALNTAGASDPPHHR